MAIRAAPVRPLRGQGTGVTDTEAPPDFARKSIGVVVEPGSERVGSFRRQNDSARALRLRIRHGLTHHFQQGADALIGQIQPSSIQEKRKIPEKAPAGARPIASEESMERVDQDRQIGLSRVARPDEHRHRAKIDLRLDDRPEILHLDRNRPLSRRPVHRHASPALM